ncbi:nitroreductase family deazaflavin-dependent oxidoreductase [Actinoplanes sp. NPDC049596]|uniref:nitroreductase family deazaflavin-dependent oxidoreductase n=1 Tax=unclassified Actinoplanes TaxID=2626549 RepID=UPI00341B82FF
MLIASPLKRWMYRGGRPHGLARLLNRLSAIQFGAGFLVPRTWVTLEVPGRRTGRTVACPVVVTRYGRREYLVSMLGNDANWVANARAAGGKAILRHGRRQRIQLSEVAVDQRPPILRRYLAKAPGARPHIPVDRHSPVAAFVPIAADYPVFLVTRLGSPMG